MPRPKKPTAVKKTPSNAMVAMLVAALDYLSIVPNAKGENPLYIRGNLLTTTDGTVKAGTMLGEGWSVDADCKINLATLAHALMRTGKEVTLAFDNDAMSVKGGGDFDVYIPYLDSEGDTPVMPDAFTGWPADNRFRDAIKLVSILVKDSSEYLDTTCVVVNEMSVMATNRQTFLEAFHGNAMPPFGFLFLPKAFCTSLGKTTTDITGWSMTTQGQGTTSSFTVYFADQSFLQTNTFPNGWQLPDSAPDLMLQIASQLMNDNDPDAPEITDTIAFLTDLGYIGAVHGEDALVKLGHTRSDNGRVDLASTYYTGENGFLIPSKVLAGMAHLVGRAKPVFDATSARLIFWGADGLVRGATVIVKHVAPPPPPPVNDDFPIPAPAAQSPWGATAPAAGVVPSWGQPVPQRPAPVVVPAAPAAASHTGWGAAPAAQAQAPVPDATSQVPAWPGGASFVPPGDTDDE